MGDMNAKVGKMKYKQIAGQHGMGTRNDRGDRMIQFCEENHLVICNTFFQHDHRKLYTWKSPGDRTRNQIDYIMVRNRFKNNVKNAKTYPGADINSDHNPVVIKLQIKLKSRGIKTSRTPQIDISALKQPDISQLYLVEVKNKYDSLIVESMEQYRHENPEEKINTKWECVKTSIQIANTNLPVKENKKKQLWMTDEILSKMTQRKKAKNTPEYASIEREIRQMCRAAKETWIQIKCKEIEDLEIKHNSKEVHENIKRFTKKKNNITGNGCIRRKNGEIIVDNSDIIERWKEYTEELFWDNRSNKPALQNSQDGPKILKAEVEKAIKKMKQGKAAGPDKITTEMIKSLSNFGIDTITELCNDIYIKLGISPKI